MIGSTRVLRVWAYARPADLRRSFDGLSALVRTELGRDPLSGECYLFTNRSRTSAKVLLWDGTGLCVYHKRLEQGRFSALWTSAAAAAAGEVGVRLTLSELSLFLEGCTLVARVPLSPTALAYGDPSR